jgi:hypothetical protein
MRIAQIFLTFSPFNIQFENMMGDYTRRLAHQIFYLPHMEYEGNIGFVSRKMKSFCCRFSRLRTFYTYKSDALVGRV